MRMKTLPDVVELLCEINVLARFVDSRLEDVDFAEPVLSESREITLKTILMVGVQQVIAVLRDTFEIVRSPSRVFRFDVCLLTALLTPCTGRLRLLFAERFLTRLSLRRGLVLGQRGNSGGPDSCGAKIASIQQNGSRRRIYLIHRFRALSRCRG